MFVKLKDNFVTKKLLFVVKLLKSKTVKILDFNFET